MDVRAILKARNLSDENIEALMTKPELASVLESFITEAEHGKTSLLKAQEIETNLKTWNEQQVIPYVRAADEKVAKTEAKLARATAYMKSMKDAGYEVTDAWLEDGQPSTPPKNDAPAGFSQADFDKGAMNIAETNIALVSLSNKYRKLTGDELDLDSEYSDFKTNRRPDEHLRAYVTRKYDLAGKEAAAAEAREQKKLNDFAEEKVKAAKAEWTQSHGVNPETITPRSTRFDAISKEPERNKLWQTAQGREKATNLRLEKYANLVQ